MLPNYGMLSSDYNTGVEEGERIVLIWRSGTALVASTARGNVYRRGDDRWEVLSGAELEAALADKPVAWWP